MLPTIATHIDGMPEAAQEQYQTLLPAKARPHALDDYTVNRVKKVFTEQKNDLWLFEEQLKRCQRDLSRRLVSYDWDDMFRKKVSEIFPCLL